MQVIHLIKPISESLSVIPVISIGRSQMFSCHYQFVAHSQYELTTAITIKLRMRFKSQRDYIFTTISPIISYARDDQDIHGKSVQANAIWHSGTFF